jgi:nitrate reductase gamma subunit
MDSFLADVVVAIHAFFVVFVVVGGFLALWKPWIALVHVPAALWGAYVEFAGRICPLTPLENHLRHLAGEAGYQGGFIAHYITPILYPEGLTREMQVAFGGSVVAINVLAYALLIWRLRRSSTRQG